MKKLKRRIFVFLDGTWNDDFISDRDTNIVRLRNYIYDAIAKEPAEKSIGEIREINEKEDEFGAIRHGDYQYLIFYERGVGTGPGLDRLFSGLTGHGLELNIRRAYRYLCAKYRDGDEIFIFGFSRGAFTARSLVNMIDASGLLKYHECTSENESKAWLYYRRRANDRFSGDRAVLDKLVHSRNRTRVSCLAVFDTVGALGIPLTKLQLYNRARFEFHDVELSPIVDLNLHALAIDECRVDFPASVWRRNRNRNTETIVEQVWFPGVHADVGGGYYNKNDHKFLPTKPIEEISLDWMIKRLKHHFPDFPNLNWTFEPGPPTKTPSIQNDSLTRKFKLRGQGIRSIGNLLHPAPKGAIVVGYDRNQTAICEAVHISAIERLGRSVIKGSVEDIYAPCNLVECAEKLYSRYVAGTNRLWQQKSLSIVNWNGDFVKKLGGGSEPEETQQGRSFSDDDRVVMSLREARKRLVGLGILDELPEYPK